MGYFKRSRKKLPKPDKDGNLPATSCLFMAEAYEKEWKDLGEKFALETELMTGKVPLVVFAMFHGLRPTECRAWCVNGWTLEDWDKARTSFDPDGFIPFGHIAVTPLIEGDPHTKWMVRFMPALKEWQGRPFEAIQSRVDKALDVVDWNANTYTEPVPPQNATFEPMPESSELIELRRKAKLLWPGMNPRRR